MADAQVYDYHKTTSLELAQATQLSAAGQHLEAEKIFRRMLGDTTTDPMLLTLMANNYSAAEHFPMAVMFYERALELGVPAEMYGKVVGNLGFNYHRLGRTEEARFTIEKALDWMEANVDKIDIEDTRAIASAHMACTHINQGEPLTGLIWMDKALKLPHDPSFDDNFNWNKSLLLLEAGRYQEGWDAYELAIKYGGRADRPYRFGQETPFWDGSPAENHSQTLVIYGEQGIGDEVLFSTMFEEAADRWEGNVILDVTPRLVEPFRRSFHKMEVYGSLTAELPDWADHRFVDAKIAMGSLGKYFRKEPADFEVAREFQGDLYPPLEPSPAHIARLYNQLEHLPHAVNVGVSWAGGTVLTNAKDRTIDLDLLKPLLDHFPVNWISLQHGTEAGNQAASLNVHHWREDLDDIDSQLALIKCCDLVISVCGTPVHFAGALGVECWVMAPTAIRWCYGLEGEQMPWYQSVKMYRQKIKGEWHPVIQKIGDDLGNHLRGLSPAERSTASAAE